MTNELRALLIYSVVLAGGGFAGGRGTAPSPEVRYVTIEVPAPIAKPKPVVTKPVPLPKPRPKVHAKPKPKPRAVSRQRKPTADECAQMRSAGRTVVKAGGRLRGYSNHQIELAMKDCGI